MQWYKIVKTNILKLRFDHYSVWKISGFSTSETVDQRLQRYFFSEFRSSISFYLHKEFPSRHTYGGDLTENSDFPNGNSVCRVPKFSEISFHLHKDYRIKKMWRFSINKMWIFSLENIDNMWRFCIWNINTCEDFVLKTSTKREDYLLKTLTPCEEFLKKTFTEFIFFWDRRITVILCGCARLCEGAQPPQPNPSKRGVDTL